MWQKGTLCNEVTRISKVKKLLLVLATSMSMTGTRKETLECVFYIHYPVQFKKNTNKTQVQALTNLGIEINVIHLTFAKQLDLPIRPIDVEVQKIDGSTMDIYKMVIAAFSIMDKANQVRFFEKTFLVANVSPKVVFGMLFLILSGANIDFLD